MTNDTLETSPSTYFKDGDTVVFFGDSITHGGFYYEYLTAFYRTRFPHAKIRLINSGIGGDTASLAYPRIDVDIKEYNPTHIAFHFGMNDVGRGYYVEAPTPKQLEGAEKAQINYRQSFQRLVAKVKEAAPNAKHIYITPTPYDDTATVLNIPAEAPDWAKVNQKGCNTGLALIAGYVLSSAKTDGVQAIDWFTPLNNLLMEKRQTDPYFMLTRFDRVHPAELGHSIMAWHFLMAQEVPATVSDVTIDSLNEKVEKSDNAVISNLAFSKDGAIAFDMLASSIPFPVPPEAKDFLEKYQVEEKLNQEILTVSNLENGSYRLLIDSIEVGTYNADEFAQGVKLAFNEKTPQYQQAQEFFKLNHELAQKEIIIRNHHSARWYYYNQAPVDDLEAFKEWFEKNVPNKKEGFANHVPGYLAYWGNYRKTREELWEAQESVRLKAKPKSHHYEIKSISR